jgi:electron transfer flavoprotein beta subunit
MDVRPDRVIARRETGGGFELYQIELPAVLTVREGLNLPRHPSLRGTMTARKKPVERVRPSRFGASLELVRLAVPAVNQSGAEMLGEGRGAVPRIASVLEQLELL